MTRRSTAATPQSDVPVNDELVVLHAKFARRPRVNLAARALAKNFRLGNSLKLRGTPGRIERLGELLPTCGHGQRLSCDSMRRGTTLVQKDGQSRTAHSFPTSTTAGHSCLTQLPRCRKQQHVGEVLIVVRSISVSGARPGPSIRLSKSTGLQNLGTRIAFSRVLLTLRPSLEPIELVAAGASVSVM